MSPINFVYWLQGFLEIGDPKSLNEVQIQEIRNHIGLVLDKQTPIQTVLFEHGKPNLNEDIYIFKDMNGNPFPLDLLTFKHHASC